MRERSKYLRAVLRFISPVWRFRPLALWSELQFWDRWLRRLPDGPDRTSLSAERLVARRFWPLIERSPSNPVRILEVGSGPIPSMGTRHPTRRVEVVATDVLAEQYNRLLSRHGIALPVRAIYADMENLARQFGSNAFDLVLAANCVDHAEHALRAIQEMVEVVRPGGHVVMEHIIDEGVHQDYTGLHQWNLNAVGGRLLLWNDHARYDVAEILGPSCEVHTECENGIVKVEIRKRP